MKLWAARVVPPLLNASKPLPRTPTFISAARKQFCVWGGGFGAANNVRALSGAGSAELSERRPQDILSPTPADHSQEPAAFVLFDYEGFLRKHGDSPVGGQLQMALEAGATDGDCMSLVRLWQQRGLLIPESSFSLLLDKVIEGRLPKPEEVKKAKATWDAPVFNNRYSRVFNVLQMMAVQGHKPSSQFLSRAIKKIMDGGDGRNASALLAFLDTLYPSTHSTPGAPGADKAGGIIRGKPADKKAVQWERFPGLEPLGDMGQQEMVVADPNIDAWKAARAKRSAKAGSASLDHILSVLARNGDAKHAVAVIEHVYLSGRHPTVEQVSKALDACLGARDYTIIRSASNLQCAVRLVEIAFQSAKGARDSVVPGLMSYQRTPEEKLYLKNVSTWTSRVLARCENLPVGLRAAGVTAALRIFNSIVHPSMVHFKARNALKAKMAGPKEDGAGSLHQPVPFIAGNRQPVPFIAASFQVLITCMKSFALEESVRVYEAQVAMMDEPLLKFAIAIMRFLCSNGRIQLAKDMAERMDDRGHLNSLVHLSCLLIVACRSGDRAWAKMFYTRLLAKGETQYGEDEMRALIRAIPSSGPAPTSFAQFAQTGQRLDPALARGNPDTMAQEHWSEHELFHFAANLYEKMPPLVAPPLL